MLLPMRWVGLSTVAQVLPWPGQLLSVNDPCLGDSSPEPLEPDELSTAACDLPCSRGLVSPLGLQPSVGIHQDLGRFLG